MFKLRNVALVCFFSGFAAVAQAQSLAKGISVAFPSGGGATFGYVHFMDADNSRRLNTGLSFTKNEGTSATMGLSVDAGYRTYVASGDKVKAFCQPGIFLAKSEGGAGELMDKITLAVTYGIGGEYWLSNNFTLGAS